MVAMNIFCYWGGNMINTAKGVSYSKTKYQFLRVSWHTPFEVLKRQIYDAIRDIPAHRELKLTCRMPLVNVNGSVTYIGFQVENNVSEKAMFGITDIPGTVFVESYVEVEDIHSTIINEPGFCEFAPYSQLLSRDIGINEFYSNT